MNKPFKTIDEQIKILDSRNLSILSEEQARTNLMRYGYYEIVNGYKDIFLEDPQDENNEEIFKEGTTFEILFDLFMFDNELRQAVFSSLTEFELNFRTALAYTMGKYLGVTEQEYMTRENYKSGKKVEYRGKTEYQRDGLLRKFRHIINDDVQPMMHYREAHGHIPPWILLKGTSFGNLVILYKLLKGKLKSEIVSVLYGLDVEIIDDNDEFKELFSDSLALFLKYRNRAAHSGRIYNYNPDKTIIRYRNFLHNNRLNISEADYRNGIGQNDIRILLATLQMLENKEAFYRLYSSLSKESKSINKKYPGFMSDLSNAMNIELDILINIEKIK